MIPQECVERIRGVLDDFSGLSLAITGPSTLEVREATGDGLNTLFPLSQEREAIETPTKVRASSIRAPRTPENMGFAGVELSTDFSDTLDEVQTARLRGIIGEHLDLLSRTKPGSGIWNRTLQEVGRLADGTFGSSHPWTQAWLSRMTRRGCDPQRFGFADVDAVLDALDGALGWITERFDKGLGYWWPRGRRSLLDFIVSGSRDGSCTSPFCETWGLAFGWEAQRDALDKQTIAEVGRFIDGDTQRVMTGSGLRLLWGNVRELVEWYNRNRETLVGASLGNKVRLSDAAGFIRLVGNWAQGIRSTYHPFTWLRPGTDPWVSFVTWMDTQHGIKIPGGCR